MSEMERSRPEPDLERAREASAPRGILMARGQVVDMMTGEALVRCAPCSSTGSIRGVGGVVYEDPCRRCGGHGYHHRKGDR